MRGVERCEQCHGEARFRVEFPEGSNLLCSECIAYNESCSDEVDAHEMAVFGGAYGLCPRPVYIPLPTPKDRPDV